MTDPTAADVYDAVRALHQPRRTLNADGEAVPYCVEDRQAWPCATMRAACDATGVDPNTGQPRTDHDPF